jgi:chromosome segregation ATPase
MRQATAYRQMEISSRMNEEDMHSPEQMRQQVEQARQQAEYYEAQRRELEESTERKTLFNESLNEIGMKLHNAVRRLDRELESMDREQAEIAQINECLKRHLQILSSMRPQTWGTDTFNERLNEAIPKLDRAINDFEEAYSGPSRYRHTEIFRYKPGIDERRGIDWETFRSKAAQGFFFHLPLFILLLITWGVYTLISHI